MNLHEIYAGLESIRPGLCSDMEHTCDECPFGVWNDTDCGYDCGIQIFQKQIKSYETQEPKEELNMGKAKFTPTPWRRFIYGNSQCIGIEDKNGQIICDCFEQQPSPVFKKPGISTEEKLANVSLLESAPDLYRALVFAVQDKCSNCGFAVATAPVDFCKDCKYKTFAELIKKVEAGK